MRLLETSFYALKFLFCARPNRANKSETPRRQNSHLQPRTYGKFSHRVEPDTLTDAESAGDRSGVDDDSRVVEPRSHNGVADYAESRARQAPSENHRSERTSSRNELVRRPQCLSPSIATGAHSPPNKEMRGGDAWLHRRPTLSGGG